MMNIGPKDLRPGQKQQRSQRGQHVRSLADLGQLITAPAATATISSDAHGNMHIGLEAGLPAAADAGPASTPFNNFPSTTSSKEINMNTATTTQAAANTTIGLGADAVAQAMGLPTMGVAPEAPAVIQAAPAGATFTAGINPSASLGAAPVDQTTAAAAAASTTVGATQATIETKAPAKPVLSFDDFNADSFFDEKAKSVFDPAYKAAAALGGIVNQHSAVLTDMEARVSKLEASGGRRVTVTTETNNSLEQFGWEVAHGVTAGAAVGLGVWAANKLVQVIGGAISDESTPA